MEKDKTNTTNMNQNVKYWKFKLNMIKDKTRLLLILAVLLILPFVVFLTLRGVKILTTRAGTARLYFEPSSSSVYTGDTVTLSVLADSGTTPVGAIHVDIMFDRSKLALKGEVTSSTILKRVIQKTSKSQTDTCVTTCKITLAQGLDPLDKNNPPKGIFDLAKITFTPVARGANIRTTVSINSTTAIVVETNTRVFTKIIQNATIIINPTNPTITGRVTPTPTRPPNVSPTPVPTRTITPTPSVTPTPTTILSPTITPTPIEGGAYNWGPFRPGLTLIEIQAWWTPVPDDEKGFGHEHVLCWWPLGRRVKDVFPNGFIKTDCRITLHNNPSTASKLAFHLAPGNVIKTINLGLRCTYPGTNNVYDGVNPLNCSWNVPVTLDTNGWPSGWRHLRVRAVQSTPDNNTWTTSSEIPMLIDGSSSGGEFPNCIGDPSNGKACFIGKSWYTNLGYQNVELKNIPLTPVKKGNPLTFHIRASKGAAQLLQAFLDRSHFIPAVGPWPQENPITGPDLSKPIKSEYDVTIDTSNLSLGWHSFATRSVSQSSLNSSCAGGCFYSVTNPNFETGVAKFWFYIVP